MQQHRVALGQGKDFQHAYFNTFYIRCLGYLGIGSIDSTLFRIYNS